MAAIEITWVYHNVYHNHSFRSMDCTSKLLKKFLDPKFSCARTKTRAGIANVIAKWMDEMVMKEIEAINVGVIASDTSNLHGDHKILPVLFRYCFIQDDGTINLRNAILNLHELKNETAKTVEAAIMVSVREYKIQDKVSALMGDNANVNFGCLNPAPNRKTDPENVHALLVADWLRSSYS